jgi:hypothetical protein
MSKIWVGKTEWNTGKTHEEIRRLLEENRAEYYAVRFPLEWTGDDWKFQAVSAEDFANSRHARIVGSEKIITGTPLYFDGFSQHGKYLFYAKLGLNGTARKALDMLPYAEEIAEVIAAHRHTLELKDRNDPNSRKLRQNEILIAVVTSNEQDKIEIKGFLNIYNPVSHVKLWDDLKEQDMFPLVSHVDLSDTAFRVNLQVEKRTGYLSSWGMQILNGDSGWHTLSYRVWGDLNGYEFSVPFQSTRRHLSTVDETYTNMREVLDEILLLEMDQLLDNTHLHEIALPKKWRRHEKFMFPIAEYAHQPVRDFLRFLAGRLHEHGYKTGAKVLTDTIMTALFNAPEYEKLDKQAAIDKLNHMTVEEGYKAICYTRDEAEWYTTQVKEYWSLQTLQFAYPSLTEALTIENDEVKEIT